MNQRLLSDHFKKCFVAGNGLWFMMLEKVDLFERAWSRSTGVEGPATIY
jgi:hypothetical protein